VRLDPGQGAEEGRGGVSLEPTEGAPIPSPRRLGRYEICGKIASGGMAAIYVARCLSGTHAGELVAIKMIRDEFARSLDFVTMFNDEATIAVRLRHPNIVRCHDLGHEGGRAYLAMELLLGQSLWNVWDSCRSRGLHLGYEVIAWIGARVASGLHHAHELVDEAGLPLNVVHRDVNATNIFITYDGAIKVIDFGLAKAANRASKTAAGIIKGKVAYMSPEQTVGAPIDRRTDVFALGTTLWELSCDRRLFKQADELETLKRVHAAQVPDPTKLVGGYPRPLWRCLQRALARDAAQRYATAADFARQLDAFADGRSDGEVADEVGPSPAQTLATLMARLFREAPPRPMADWGESIAFTPRVTRTSVVSQMECDEGEEPRTEVVSSTDVLDDVRAGESVRHRRWPTLRAALVLGITTVAILGLLAGVLLR
jgi:serine/threonine-protein kinase